MKIHKNKNKKTQKNKKKNKQTNKQKNKQKQKFKKNKTKQQKKQKKQNKNKTKKISALLIHLLCTNSIFFVRKKLQNSSGYLQLQILKILVNDSRDGCTSTPLSLNHPHSI